MSAQELFKDPKRLKSLLKELDKADGDHDNVIHRDIALKHIEALRSDTSLSPAFLDAAKEFIENGPEIQRRLSNQEIDALSDVVKSPLPKSHNANKSNGLA